MEEIMDDAGVGEVRRTKQERIEGASQPILFVILSACLDHSWP